MPQFWPFDAKAGWMQHLRVPSIALAIFLAVPFSAPAQNPTPIFPIPATLDGAYIGPGRGLTKDFEIQFMEFTIDHHFSALRITELAAAPHLRGSPRSHPRTVLPKHSAIRLLRRKPHWTI